MSAPYEEGKLRYEELLRDAARRRFRPAGQTPGNGRAVLHACSGGGACFGWLDFMSLTRVHAIRNNLFVMGASRMLARRHRTGATPIPR